MTTEPHFAAAKDAKGFPETMTYRAEGSFYVKNVPFCGEDVLAGTSIGSFVLDKLYLGDLEASAKGEMLGVGDPGAGSAGYVALEQVTGTLQGRKGSFALQHSGTMDGGSFELKVIIVPGSGTDQLAGIAGAATFRKTDGTHMYSLDYVLPDAR